VPLGQTGNSVGETWVDNTASYYMRVWTGAAWQKVGAGFADSAVTAGTAGSATTAVLASGCIAASGTYSAVISSGALTATAASGTIVASGVPITASLPVSSPTGTLMYLAAAPSGLYIYVGGAWVQV